MASEEEEVPLVVYLKENAALLTVTGSTCPRTEAQQESPNPTSRGGPQPRLQMPAKPSLSGTTLVTPASNDSHNLPATDVNQNLLGSHHPTEPASLQRQQNSSGAASSK